MSQFRARRDALDWTDFDWLRKVWQRKLLLKGVLAAEDAARAARHGVDGIIVSNHGGRQLDGAVSPLDVLPEIAAAVGATSPCSLMEASGADPTS
jgi:isopentenyl diphosphate isomerase/L-lactate dehydrogenase-like FMN-dependent dehydrogenase